MERFEYLENQEHEREDDLSAQLDGESNQQPWGTPNPKRDQLFLG
jgi:hypothetical protein